MLDLYTVCYSGFLVAHRYTGFFTLSHPAEWKQKNNLTHSLVLWWNLSGCSIDVPISGQVSSSSYLNVSTKKWINFQAAWPLRIRILPDSSETWASSHCWKGYWNYGYCIINIINMLYSKILALIIMWLTFLQYLTSSRGVGAIYEVRRRA